MEGVAWEVSHPRFQLGYCGLSWHLYHDQQEGSVYKIILFQLLALRRV
jgi:hypothetical protein